MKKQYIKYIVIAAIVILFFYCIFLVLSKKQPPAAVTTQGSTAALLTVPAKNGSVQVNDFTKTPARTAGDTVVIAESSEFSIIYFTKDQSFLISILSQPVQAARDAAEQEFLTKLGVDKVVACRLTTSLTVPASVDESLAGQDYGLSFCPLGQHF